MIYHPRTPQEAVNLRKEHADTAVYLAGGTDDLRLGGVQLHLIVARVYLRHELSLANLAAFFDMDVHQRPADLESHIHFFGCLHASGKFLNRCGVGVLDRKEPDNGSFRFCRLPVTARADSQQPGKRQKYNTSLFHIFPFIHDAKLVDRLGRGWNEFE